MRSLSRVSTSIAWLLCIGLSLTSQFTASGQEREVVGQVKTGDWPMWGGDPSRNQANRSTGVSIAFELPSKDDPGKKILWTAPLGTQTYSSLSVAGGKVFVGTNNGNTYRPGHKGDRGGAALF